MFKKCLAIILSTALALGILVQGSFAFNYWSAADTNWETLIGNSSTIGTITDYIDTSGFEYMFLVTRGETSGYNDNTIVVLSNKPLMNAQAGGFGLCSFDSDVRFRYYTIKSDGTIYSYNDVSSYYRDTDWGGYHLYWYLNSTNVWWLQRTGTGFASYDFLQEDDNDIANWDPISYSANLVGLPWQDNRYMDVYMSGSTYGNVRYLCIEVDDVVLSSSWLSVRFNDYYGAGTYIQDFPFDYFTANGHSFIKIMPDRIDNIEFTVTSVLYSGSSSWGLKEVDGLDLTFNESIFPSPIPSVVPVPDYSYFDTTYINYNGGEKDIIYTPISCDLEIGYLFDDQSKFYFLDYAGYFLIQPFSYSFIVIPNIQYDYSSFLNDCIYQYDVVIDDFQIVTYNGVVSFDRIYGSGAWADLAYTLDHSGLTDVSSVLESWYALHDPVVYQFPYIDDWVFNFDERQYDCSLIITDSFFFKQTNYLLGDTGDILSEFSERFFKIDGFSDSLFENISSLYNLNLQYFDSSLQALTGLSYWLNDNDLSSNLSDLSNLLTSVDSYLSSVDSKLNYLVTIDSDLNDLLEWFQNQEDSDVVLSLPDFNPTILIELYGQNIGDLVGFFQGFVNVLPDFDFSDFPNFFDYAADLVDDVAGQDNDVINDLYQPYDYSDSGLHEFGWD